MVDIGTGHLAALINVEGTFDDLMSKMTTSKRDKQSDRAVVKKALELISKTKLKSKEKALEYAHRAFQFAKDINFTEGIVETGIHLSELYWSKSEFKISLEYAEISLKYNEAIKSKAHEAHIYKCFGNSYLRMGFLDKALNYYFQSLEICKILDNNNEYAAICNNIGVVYKDKGEYEKALSYYMQSLEIKKNAQDFNALSNVYINIGIMYYHQQEYDKSLKYLEKILNIAPGELSEVVLANVHNNIGQVCVELRDYKKAIDHIQIALDINAKTENKNGMAHSYQEIGRIMQLKNEYHTAIKSYEKALRLSQEIGSLSNEAGCLYLLGSISYEMNDYEKAEAYLLKSYEINKELDIKPPLAATCELLSELYHDTDRFSESCMYMRHLLKLQEELSNEEKTRLLAEMKTRFELQQRDSTIETLNVKQELLLKANQELELFAGKAAHDLKEPLRMMSSFSSLLVRKYGEQLDETGKEFVSHIHEGAKRMEKLLTDMLTFAKSGADPSDSISVNLNDILHVVKSNLRLKIDETQADIQYKNLPTVRAANVAMIQLFQNIIANALKFSKPDTLPLIQIETTDYDDNFYQISIADNGIGIPESQTQKVFIIFQRLHAKLDYEGSGIGLATCKKIVECLGGKIWLESIEGKGTTFFFLLPKDENITK